MRLGKKRWMGIAFGATIFLVAFGLALAQQLFQVRPDGARRAGRIRYCCPTRRTARHTVQEW